LPRFKIRSVARTRLGLPLSCNAVQQSWASSRTGIGEQPSIKQGGLAEACESQAPSPLSAQPQTSYAQPTSTGGTSQTEVAGWQGKIVEALCRSLGTERVLNLALQNVGFAPNVL
jgi:hypothetical protein